jgi:hypothetical protein
MKWTLRASRSNFAIMSVAPSTRQAIQYDIGNPLTASRMTEHQLSAALYAPIRVLLRESPDSQRLDELLPSCYVDRSVL